MRSKKGIFLIQADESCLFFYRASEVVPTRNRVGNRSHLPPPCDVDPTAAEPPWFHIQRTAYVRAESLSSQPEPPAEGLETVVGEERMEGERRKPRRRGKRRRAEPPPPEQGEAHSAGSSQAPPHGQRKQQQPPFPESKRRKRGGVTSSQTTSSSFLDKVWGGWAYPRAWFYDSAVNQSWMPTVVQRQWHSGKGSPSPCWSILVRISTIYESSIQDEAWYRVRNYASLQLKSWEGQHFIGLGLRAMRLVHSFDTYNRKLCSAIVRTWWYRGILRIGTSIKELY